MDGRLTGKFAEYEYGNNGNRTRETYMSNNPLEGDFEVFQDARVTYDELNRVKHIIDGNSNKTFYDLSYEYDEVGNRRRVRSAYNDGADVQDYYYLYDALNRFTLTKGTLENGQIGRGESGLTIGYEGAGTPNERMTMEVGVAGSGSNPYRKERYTYSGDGYLDRVYIQEEGGSEVLRVDRINNLVGDRIGQLEYGADGSLFSETRYTYTADHHMVEERDRRWDYDENSFTNRCDTEG